MRKEKKNIALFFELKPDGLDAIMQDGFCLLKFAQRGHKGQSYFTWIVFRKGFEADAFRLKEIVTDVSSGLQPEREHEIGKLLSYTKEEVEAYIAHASPF